MKTFLSTLQCNTPDFNQASQESTSSTASAALSYCLLLLTNKCPIPGDYGLYGFD